MNAVNRYADVAERELKDGSVRGPAWEDALIESGGNEDLARELYQHRRVAENLELEENHNLAVAALYKLRAFNDSIALTLGQKVMLTLTGVLVGIALWVIYIR